MALRKQVPGLARNCLEKKRLHAQFAKLGLADCWGWGEVERSGLSAAFVEGSVDNALRRAGFSRAPCGRCFVSASESAEEAETQAAHELQQALAAVSSAASKADNGADEARLPCCSQGKSKVLICIWGQTGTKAAERQRSCKQMSSTQWLLRSGTVNRAKLQDGAQAVP